ncbi:MAG: O-antigen ligase family protein [Hymenobacteraceae bacterium]|nr:O-antigen ligase family protein [Hymenobacteraceae bacterium]MDX5482206.1 O-antigen ligase family protein [Hymenobacteraceae bacterium]
MSQTSFNFESGSRFYLYPLAVILAIFVGWLIAIFGFAVPVILFALALVIPFVITVFNHPKVGLLTLIGLSFMLFFVLREIANLPLSFAFEGLLILTWAAAVLHNSKQYDWSLLKNDLTLLGLVWFGITLLQLFNPEARSVLAWVVDSRYPLMWLLLVPLCLVMFNKNRDLNLFLWLIIGFSVLAALNGIKQLEIGLFPGEQRFLSSGGHRTHLLFGRLRVFSFYSDAGQFGASQAHIALIALILALGPFKMWKKVVFAGAAALLLYGMLISGTRGALFTLLVGIFIALLINKNIKLLVIGSFFALSAVLFLKYTYIGHDIYQIRRMRTALNPEDASFQVRLINQARLADYLSSRPFGGGIGSIGHAAKNYSNHTFLSSIPPDSYWVKIWAMYGIVGMCIWFGIMMYILGKCCGIVWNTQDKALKSKLTALTAGAAGIFFSSYGNEIMNNVPSSIIVYISWAFVFLGPKLDKEAKTPDTYA